MKRLLVVLAFVLALTGCATMSLPPDATQAQKDAAKCEDARKALAVAQITLNVAVDPAERAYWQRYIAGLRDIMHLYCTEAAE